MRIRHLAIAVALALAATTAPAVAADTEETPGAITGVLTPEEEAEMQAAADPDLEIDMYYNGEKIDPAGDWEGAQICAEVDEDGTMECFDDDTEANSRLATAAPTKETRQGAAAALTGQARQAMGSASVLAYDDCRSGWVCLWQDANYKGRRLQWPTYDTSKTRHLDIYSPSFRDKASSAAVMRSQRGVTLYDIRNNLPDPKLILASGYTIWPRFSSYDYPVSGNWNDKADAIRF
ncbi:peptidase inhibitor family I36 protein [Streptomyces europaeiscabiei]|uniref:peptidase inhibitor family I36 protein n=1 Tax=Streptomyces europaeiscabiei TaxID=146819 RepID=UPI002E197CCE